MRDRDSASSLRLEHVVFTEAEVGDIDALAGVFWRAREVAMPWLAKTQTPIQTRAWMRTTLFRQSEIAVVRWGLTGPQKPVAFAAWKRDKLQHFYVHPEHQRQGIGQSLFSRVSRRMPGGFEFWVFQRNTAARTFYEKLGCVLVRETDGASNPEREPDALYRWAGTIS